MDASCLRVTIKRPGTVYPLRRSLMALSVLIAYSCGPINVRMERLIEGGHYRDAAEAGYDWLRAGGNGQAAQTERVELLIATARMKAAISSKDVEKIAAFRRVYGTEDRFSKLVAHALERESVLYLETVARPRDSVIVYRRFRETYPETSVLAQVQELEVRAALRDARALKSADAYKRIRLNYGTWSNTRTLTRVAIREEAKLVYETHVRIQDDLISHQEFRSIFGALTELPSIQLVRDRELQLALDRAKAEDMLIVYDQFITTYTSWPESKRALKEIRRLRARRALKDAMAIGTRSAFDSFRRQHTDPTSIDAVDKAEIKSMFQMFETAIRNSHRIALGIGRPFIEKYRNHRFLKDAVDPVKTQLQQRLVDLPDRWSARLFRLAYPNEPGNQELLKAEMALAWSEASQPADPEKLLDYVLWYPQSDTAQQAEELLFKTGQKPVGDTVRVHVAHTVSKALGQRIQASITGCDGQRHIGLPAHSFRLNGRNMKPASDTPGRSPIDIVFLVDLSGSLLSERTQIITNLAQMDADLRVNGLNPRYSVVGFAKSVVEQRSWFNEPKPVADAMSQLPLSSLQAHEDSVGALLATTRLNYRDQAFRVVVMVTDEPLTFTAATMAKAKIKRPKNCAQAAKTAACLKACKGSKKRPAQTRFACIDRCVKTASTDHKKAYLACIKRVSEVKSDNTRPLLERKAECLERVDVTAIGTAAECRQPLAKAPKVKASLRRSLSRAGLQAYFLHPTGLSRETELEPLGKVSWARRFKYSRMDKSKGLAQSLRRVLNDILGTHLVRPKTLRNSWSTKAKLEIKRPLLWHKVSGLPPGRLLDLYRIEDRQRCHREYALTDTTGIFFREACTGPWTSLEKSEHIRPKTAFSNANSIWILTHGGQVYRLEGLTGHLEETTPQGIRVGDVVEGHGTVFLHGIKTNDAFGVWTWNTDKSAWTESALPVELGGLQTGVFVPTNAVSQHGVCLQSSSEDVWCYQTQKGAWKRSLSTGLPQDFIKPETSVIALSKTHTAGLVFAPDGTFYRTISGGRGWRHHETPLGPIKSVALSRLGKADVCASNKTTLFCSADLGRTWTKLDRIKVPDVLIEYQGHVHGVINGSLYRLERMLDRRAYAFASSVSPTDGLIRSADAKRYLASSFLSNQHTSVQVSVHGMSSQRSRIQAWLLGLSGDARPADSRVDFGPVQPAVSGRSYVQFTVSTSVDQPEVGAGRCR
ncbi:MAG: hypothetical protein CMH52_05895 [Myxococcales bacterium]|nr:hypothetical protein [Myxococcales bacterium]